MAYRIAARFYASDDQNGEAYVIVSDNIEKDRKYEVGRKVFIKPESVCPNCNEPLSRHNFACQEYDNNEKEK